MEGVLKSQKPLKRYKPLSRQPFRLNTTNGQKWKPLPNVSKDPKRRARRFIPCMTKIALRKRSEGICEVVISGRRCSSQAVDPHHLLPKGRGGKNNLGNLLHVCRSWLSRLDCFSGTRDTSHEAYNLYQDQKHLAIP